MTPGSPPVGVFMPELQHAGTVSVLVLSPIYYVIQQMHLLCARRCLKCLAHAVKETRSLMELMIVHEYVI